MNIRAKATAESMAVITSLWVVLPAREAVVLLVIG